MSHWANSDIVLNALFFFIQQLPENRKKSILAGEEILKCGGARKEPVTIVRKSLHQFLCA